MEKEKELQKKVQAFISDPSKVWTAKSGKKIQILACGSLNLFVGPDFKDIGALIDGKIIVGDAEFHIKTSDWKAHKHSDDKNYEAVALHIALIDDCDNLPNSFETLIIDKKDLDNFKIEESEFDSKAEALNLEEVQHYALIRLLRKSTIAQKALFDNQPLEAFKIIFWDFLNRYNSRRRRPVYSNDKLNSIAQALDNSELAKFILQVKNISQENILDALQSLTKLKIADEGAHLRREIILNCALPMAICLANEDARVMLFLWYWSSPALNSYGILKRKFENLPQNFIWQQQGMLEFLNERNQKKHIITESLQTYAIGEILSFYRYGKLSFDDNFED